MEGAGSIRGTISAKVVTGILIILKEYFIAEFCDIYLRVKLPILHAP